jgi:hypothetical protein
MKSLIVLTTLTLSTAAQAETVMLNCTGSQTAKFTSVSPVTAPYDRTIALNLDEKTMRFAGGGTTVIPVTLTDEIVSFDFVTKHTKQDEKDSHFAGTLDRFSGQLRIVESGGMGMVTYRNETTATCTVVKQKMF